MQNRLKLLLLCLLCLSILVFSYKQLRANETELLAFQALQAYASLPLLQKLLATEVEKNVRVKAIPNLFAQQQGGQPSAGASQLDNFGALSSWDNILHQLQDSPDQQRLLILIRHAQAWENLNPTSNANCEFSLDNEIIENFDSPLTPKGIEQANALNQLLRSVASNDSTKTWFETIGLTKDTTKYVTSPLSRTMQTTEYAFDSLPLASDGSFIANELLRATIGRDVCNFRHSVKTPTSATILPYPWQTGCSIPNSSLIDIYASSAVKFTFPIRPAGGNGFGLISDEDVLWRADTADDKIIVTRAKAFLAQVYENTAASSVIAVVTHGEMVSAIYQAAGESPCSVQNTEVVPLMVRFG